MKQELEAYTPVGKAISKLLSPFAEVVIHDLEQDRIEAIFNNLSCREVGDSSYLDRINFKDDFKQEIIGPYEKTNYDGRKLKSISTIIRNKESKAVGFLCINLDISVFEKYRNILTQFLGTEEDSMNAKTKSLFKDDLYEQINLFVQKCCRENLLNQSNLSRTNKLDIILALKKEGALQGKNAANYIARALGMSRASVYNYLKEEEIS